MKKKDLYNEITMLKIEVEQLKNKVSGTSTEEEKERKEREERLQHSFNTIHGWRGLTTTADSPSEQSKKPSLIKRLNIYKEALRNFVCVPSEGLGLCHYFQVEHDLSIKDLPELWAQKPLSKKEKTYWWPLEDEHSRKKALEQAIKDVEIKLAAKDLNQYLSTERKNKIQEEIFKHKPAYFSSAQAVKSALGLDARIPYESYKVLPINQRLDLYLDAYDDYMKSGLVGLCQYFANRHGIINLKSLPELYEQKPEDAPEDAGKYWWPPHDGYLRIGALGRAIEEVKRKLKPANPPKFEEGDKVKILVSDFTVKGDISTVVKVHEKERNHYKLKNGFWVEEDDLESYHYPPDSKRYAKCIFKYNEHDSVTVGKNYGVVESDLGSSEEGNYLIWDDQHRYYWYPKKYFKTVDLC